MIYYIIDQSNSVCSKSEIVLYTSICRDISLEFMLNIQESTEIYDVHTTVANYACTCITEPLHVPQTGFHSAGKVT